MRVPILMDYTAFGDRTLVVAFLGDYRTSHVDEIVTYHYERHQVFVTREGVTVGERSYHTYLQYIQTYLSEKTEHTKPILSKRMISWYFLHQEDALRFFYQTVFQTTHFHETTWLPVDIAYNWGYVRFLPRQTVLASLYAPSIVAKGMCSPTTQLVTMRFYLPGRITASRERVHETPLATVAERYGHILQHCDLLAAELVL